MLVRKIIFLYFLFGGLGFIGRKGVKNNNRLVNCEGLFVKLCITNFVDRYWFLVFSRE